MAGAPQGPLFNAHISRTESIGALDKAQQDEEIARLKEAIEEGIEDTVWSEQFEWVATLRVLALCHSSVLMNEAKLLKACLPIVAKFENAARSVLSHLAIICFGDILRNCADFFKAKGNQDCMNEAIAMLLESTRRAKARVVKEEATKVHVVMRPFMGHAPNYSNPHAQIMQQVGADLGLANLMLPAIINAGVMILSHQIPSCAPETCHDLILRCPSDSGTAPIVDRCITRTRRCTTWLWVLWTTPSSPLSKSTFQ